MKRTLSFMTACLIICCPAGLSRAGDRLEVTNPYSLAVPPGARSAAAFMTMTYPESGDAMVPDRLVSVETPAAGRAQIHTLHVENDVMMMRSIEDFPLPPGGTMTFSPQGPHIMMMELREPMTPGKTFPMTLVFEKAGRVDIEVQVRALGDMPMADANPNADSGHMPAAAQSHDHHH